MVFIVHRLQPYLTEVTNVVTEWSKRMSKLCRDDAIIELQPLFFVPYSVISDLTSHKAVCTNLSVGDTATHSQGAYIIDTILWVLNLFDT